MVNDFNFTIELPDGTERDVIVVAQHRNPKGYGIDGADVYAITDASTDEYLGFIALVGNDRWMFTGEGLAVPEQEQIVDFIRNFEDPD